MSKVTRDLPELEIDEELWIDLEVPYGKIREKWDQRYERELRRLVEKNIIGEKILGIYLSLFEIHDAEDREDTLEKILDEDERLGYNLLATR